jgi:hypothetical protein
MKESNINSETKRLNNFITIFHCLLIENVQSLNFYELDRIGLDWIGYRNRRNLLIILNQAQTHH